MKTEISPELIEQIVKIAVTNTAAVPQDDLYKWIIGALMATVGIVWAWAVLSIRTTNATYVKLHKEDKKVIESILKKMDEAQKGHKEELNKSMENTKDLIGEIHFLSEALNRNTDVTKDMKLTLDKAM